VLFRSSTRRIKFNVSPPESSVTAVTSNGNVALVFVDYANSEIVIDGKIEGKANVNITCSNGIAKTINLDYVVSDWSVGVVFTNVRSPFGGSHGVSGGCLYIGDDGIGKLAVVSNTPGLVYTVSFSASGSMDNGCMTMTTNGDGISANLSYHPNFSLLNGETFCGVLTITVTHTSTGEMRTIQYSLYGDFIAG
jgi:hypothetical protein